MKRRGEMSGEEWRPCYHRGVVDLGLEVGRLRPASSGGCLEEVAIGVGRCKELGVLGRT